MAIFNETYLAEAMGKSLSDSQMNEVKNAAKKNFAPAIKSALKCLQSFGNLKSVSFGIRASQGFRYDKYNDEVSCYIEGFDNYAYNKSATGSEAIKLLNEFKSDISKYFSMIQKENPGVNFVIMDYEGYDIGGFTEYMKKYVNKYDKVPSNSIGLYILLKKSEYEKLAPSESDIKEAEMKKYLKKYDEFAKFLKSPHKLSGSFWSGTIFAICKIIGMSSSELNSIVSSNIKPTGTKKINGNWFDNDPDWGKKISAKLGSCYTIESSDGEEIVYSVPNKKMYWISYEHTECEEFFNENYPYVDRDFEEAVYENDELKAELKKRFKEYDSVKKYNLIKG